MQGSAKLTHFSCAAQKLYSVVSLSATYIEAVYVYSDKNHRSSFERKIPERVLFTGAIYHVKGYKLNDYTLKYLEIKNVLSCWKILRFMGLL